MILFSLRVDDIVLLCLFLKDNSENIGKVDMKLSKDMTSKVKK